MVDKKVLKQLKVFVIGSLVLFAITGGSIIYLVVSKAFDSKRLVNSQIEYQKALTESVGKPQTIIQKYEHDK